LLYFPFQCHQYKGDLNEVLVLVVFSNKSAVFNKYVKSEGASHYLTNQNIRSDKNIYFGVTVQIEHSCIVVLVVSILPLYAIFLLDLKIF
jgi:hypothetical protein